VIRQVLDRHGLIGPYPDRPALETTVRVAPDGTRLRFLHNHDADPVEVPATAAGVELLSGDRISADQTLTVGGRDVLVLREDAR
jgi:beta-galactosidase